MKEDPLFPRDYRGCVSLGVTLVLAICLTVATVGYQPPSRPLCAGRLGAGFPAAFVCDATGESPLSSVGQIDWADADSINLLGSLVDIVFYLLLLRCAWLGVRRLSHIVGRRTRSQKPRHPTDARGTMPRLRHYICTWMALPLS